MIKLLAMLFLPSPSHSEWMSNRIKLKKLIDTVDHEGIYNKAYTYLINAYNLEEIKENRTSKDKMLDTIDYLLKDTPCEQINSSLVELIDKYKE